MSADNPSLNTSGGGRPATARGTATFSGLRFGAGLAFAVFSSACGAEIAPSGPPPLTTEQAAVVKQMDEGTVAEIALPDGKLRFVEVAPGEVMILRQTKIGAPTRPIQSDANMTLEQIFHAYAPGREVPQRLRAAMARAEAVANQPTVEEGTSLPEMLSSSGQPPAAELSGGATEKVASALASSIDQNWFTGTMCKYTAVDGHFCYATAFQGAWNSWSSHRYNALVCGDTGAARVSSSVSGNTRVIVDVPYGQCWYIGSYHGPHGFLGINLKRTFRTNIDWAESTVRFTGWYAHQDQFIGANY